MCEFIDKIGRSISMEVDDAGVDAFHNDKRIGNLRTTGIREIDERSVEPATITAWDVDTEYQRAGIATEMVKLLVEEIGQLIPAKKNIGYGGQNALTDDGEALTRHCQKLGLVGHYHDEQYD